MPLLMTVDELERFLKAEFSQFFHPDRGLSMRPCGTAAAGSGSPFTLRPFVLGARSPALR